MRLRLLLLLAASAAAFAQTKVGPRNGSLVVVGGGVMGPEVINRFIDMAGSPAAPLVFLPTPNCPAPPPTNHGPADPFRHARATDNTILALPKPQRPPSYLPF